MRPLQGESVDVDVVTELVERVATTVVTPRFRALSDGEISRKGADDVVTVVDREAEAALAAGLAEVLPGVPVVGEEAAHDDPSVLDALAGAPRCWVVDPLDGTRAFLEGSADHAVMVALVERGEAVAGWICLPAHGRTYVAERGAGAWVGGRRVVRAGPTGSPRGGVAVWGVEAADRERLEHDCLLLGGGAGALQRLWSGWEYTRLAEGRTDFLAYWRTSPWDHAPGAVLVREAGGVSRGVDGEDYVARPLGGPLIAAADDATWRTVHEALGASLRGRPGSLRG